MLQPNALVTKNQAKDRLGITGNGQDTRIEALINAASDWVEAYCRRGFHEATVTEVHKAKHYLSVQRPPIVDLVKSPGYVLHDAKAGILHSPYYTRYEHVTIEYKGGFDDIPAMVQEAALIIIQDWFTNNNPAGELQSFREGEISGTRAERINPAVPNSAVGLLTPYRLPVVVLP